MSTLTRCNHCTLEDIKRRNPGKQVEVRRLPPGDDLAGWLRVYVDGEPAGHTFMQLTERCVC